MSAYNTVLGFWTPWILLPPGNRFTLPNGVHCSPDLGSGEELSFPQNQLPSSASAGLSLTPAHPPLEKAFFCTRYLPTSQQGLIFTLDFPAWALVLLFILPLCPVSVLFSRSRDPGRAPKCYARCLNPQAGREKASKTMQLAKIGKFITDSSQGFCHIPHSGAGSEKAPSPSCYINL